MKKNTTKRSLLASVLALVMCVTMLVGTTFAWFTDSASVSVSKIEAGKLDIDVYYADVIEPKEDTVWTQLTENSELSFLRKQANGTLAQDASILWEPNCTYSLPALKIVNNGNLALKYKVLITGIQGNSELNDVIDWTMKLGDADFVMGSEHSLAAKSGNTVDADILTIQGHMDADAGNKYQGMTIEGVSITVLATQDTVENDSFSNQYDKFAQYPDVAAVTIAAGDDATVNNAVNDAIAAAKKVNTTTGKTTPTQIVLPANATVTLESGVATPAQGQTSDIKITGDKTTKIKFQNSNGGSDGSGTTYQDGANLTFQGVTISGGTEQFVARGGVVTFIDCTINGEIKKTTADKFVFSGCSFTAPVSQATYGCKDIVFDGCKFDTTDGYGIKIYSEGYEKDKTNNLTVKNCEFKNTAKKAKSAIFLDHIIDGLTYNITVESCTFDGFTAEPTANDKWGNRVLITSSFIQSGEQYVFAYQTGNTEQYHHTLDASQLVVTVK